MQKRACHGRGARLFDFLVHPITTVPHLARYIAILMLKPLGLLV
jgi:hypothetical protein